MKYALNLAEDGRVLSASFVSEHTPNDAVIVDELQDGNICDYRYVDGQYVYDPIPVEKVEEKPTQLDRIEAQVAYTAMMTDTLLEV